MQIYRYYDCLLCNSEFEAVHLIAYNYVIAFLPSTMVAMLKCPCGCNRIRVIDLHKEEFYIDEYRRATFGKIVNDGNCSKEFKIVENTVTDVYA